MEKYKLLHALNNEKFVRQLELHQLRELIKEYPYFQTAYLLLSQKIAQFSADEMRQWLPSIAMMVSNREVLYKLLHPVQNVSPATELPSLDTAEANDVPPTVAIEEETIGEGDSQLPQPNAADSAPLAEVEETEATAQTTAASDTQEPITEAETQAEQTAFEEPAGKEVRVANSMKIIQEGLLDEEYEAVMKQTNSDFKSYLMDEGLNDLTTTAEISEQARRQVEEELKQQLQARN